MRVGLIPRWRQLYIVKRYEGALRLTNHHRSIFLTVSPTTRDTRRKVKTANAATWRFPGPLSFPLSSRAKPASDTSGVGSKTPKRGKTRNTYHAPLARTSNVAFRQQLPPSIIHIPFPMQIKTEPLFLCSIKEVRGSLIKIPRGSRRGRKLGVATEVRCWMEGGPETKGEGRLSFECKFFDVQTKY